MEFSTSRVLAAVMFVCVLTFSCSTSDDGGSTGKDTTIDEVDPGLDLTTEGLADSAKNPDGDGPHKDSFDDSADAGPDLQNQPFQCIDLDGDGYGLNCYMGKDCDDTNPNFGVYCPQCALQVFEGCKCSLEGETTICYEGEPGSAGTGVCRLGQRFCQEGYWSDCQGQVLPQPESCDADDNDCDGLVDEGVLTPCGDCEASCETIGVGPDKFDPFALNLGNSENLELSIDGYLTLESSKENLAFLWVANSGQNTVTRLDTEECNQTGRYYVCANPSRTAVDQEGNLWVGCRSDGGVAKVAAAEAFCDDKNSNGVIDTARDLNDDGKVNGNELYPKGKDECVMFIVYPGGACQRALDVDAENHAWVGEWHGKKLRRLAPETGVVVQEIDIPNNPYGLVVDQDGIIWVAGRGGSKLVRVDPETGQSTQYTPNIGCFEPYGINLDNLGNVWISNCCCWHVGYRFAPDTQQWVAALTQPQPRGVAASAKGYIYIANDNSSKIAVVEAESATTLGYMDLGGGRAPRGVDLDYNGFVWAINKNTSSASKIDPETYEVVCEVPVGGSPETFTDMAGYALQSFAAPKGTYRHFFSNPAGFSSVHVDYQVTDPEQCHMKMRLRTANDEEALAYAPWQDYLGPYPPEIFPVDLATLPDMEGTMLDVELTLYAQSNTCAIAVKSIEVALASEEQ